MKIYLRLATTSLLSLCFAHNVVLAQEIAQEVQIDAASELDAELDTETEETAATTDSSTDENEVEAPPPPEVVEPKIDRRTIKVPKIDHENFEVGAYAGFMSIEDFGTDSVVGLRLAYHVTEDFFLEGVYGQSEAGLSSFEILSGAATLLTDDERDFSYYNLSLGYNILPGEMFVWNKRALTSSLYIIGGVGSTDFAGDDRFTVNAGFGTRILVSDWFAIHVDVRDHLLDIDITGEDKTAHNIEFTLGATGFF